MKALLRPLYMPLRNTALAKPVWHDLVGRKGRIQSNEIHLKLAADWLIRSQKAQNDGGSSSHFSVNGWEQSFPETTGYIIPSLIQYAHYAEDNSYLDAAIRMGEFLLDVQLDSGAFQGGNMSAEKKVPTLFNTGQILLGLCALAKETRDDRWTKAASRAGNWMCEVQDEDGCWRKGLSPYADQTPHAYNVRAAWSLLELNEIDPNPDYLSCNRKNVEWTLSRQNEKGWFADNSFYKNQDPFTHNIGYVFRGILESGLKTNQEDWINRVKIGIDQLIQKMHPRGSFFARYDAHWNSSDSSSCLTGNVQLGIILGKLHLLFGDEKYADSLRRINNYHKSLQFTSGNENTKGALKGSHPFWGNYCPYSYPNWSTKFLLDALLMEEKIRQETN